MSVIMRISSKSGKNFIDVVSNEKDFTLLNQCGNLVAKRSKDDVDGVTALMSLINDLIDNYGWKTKNVV